jgi:hypothetical protein
VPIEDIKEIMIRRDSLSRDMSIIGALNCTRGPEILITAQRTCHKAATLNIVILFYAGLGSLDSRRLPEPLRGFGR